MLVIRYDMNNVDPSKLVELRDILIKDYPNLLIVPRDLDWIDLTTSELESLKEKIEEAIHDKEIIAEM
jgi:uncharacterized protein with HEPN domain